MTTLQARVQAGVPSGGEYATAARGESRVRLADVGGDLAVQGACGDSDDQCQATGYRCAAHCAEAVNEASARLASAATMGESLRAQSDWQDAMVAYATTPYGGTVVNEMSGTACGEDTRIISDIRSRAKTLKEVHARSASIARLAATPVLAAPTALVLDRLAEPGHDSHLAPAHEAWLLKTINANAPLLARAEADGKSGYGFETDSRVRQAKSLSRDLIEADEVIADASSSDTQLHAALTTHLTLARQMSDDLDPDHVDGRAALLAQARRCLDHPNAGEDTFGAALSQHALLGADTIYSHPRLPVEVVARTASSWGKTPDLTPHTWSLLETQAQSSPAYAAFGARHHPVASTRQSMGSTLAGVRWDEVDEVSADAAAKTLWRDQSTDISDQTRELAARALLKYDGEQHPRAYAYKLVRDHDLKARYPQTPAAPVEVPRVAKRRFFNN